MVRCLTFVTIDDLDAGDILLGVEQYGYVLPDLRVKLAADRSDPLYVSPGILDQDYPVVLLPDTDLTVAGLTEAARLYLRLSGEHGDDRTAEITVLVRQPTAVPNYPEFRDAQTQSGLLLGIFVHPQLGTVGFDTEALPVARRQQPTTVRIPALTAV